jgi:hypothetical protein
MEKKEKKKKVVFGEKKKPKIGIRNSPGAAAGLRSSMAGI